MLLKIMVYRFAALGSGRKFYVLSRLPAANAEAKKGRKGESGKGEREVNNE